VCSAASVFFAATRPAVADDTTSFYNFTGGVSTDWMNGANWTSVVDGTTGTLPLAGSTADIAGGLTSVVGTVANPNPTINIEQLYIGQDADLHGPPDPANPNPTPPPANLQYPAPGVGNGELDQNAGTINVGIVDPANTTSNNGWVKIGQVAGTTGTYKMSGTATLNLNNDFFSVGEAGTGVLSVTDTATINTARFVSGRSTGGTGTTTFGNAGGTDNPTMNVNGGDFIVGDHGTATFTQTSGTITQTSGWSFVGNSGGGTGTYNMNGGSFQTNGWLVSGHGGTGSINQTAGTITTTDTLWIGVDGGSNGNYTLSGTATANISHDTRIAPNGGSTGTLTIHNGGTFNQIAGDVHVGENGAGHIVQDGGLFQASSGNWVNIGMGGSGTGTGDYTISGGTFDSGTAGARLEVGGNGQKGHGTLTVSGTATVNSNQEFNIGSSTGSTGDVIQTGGTVNALGNGIWAGNNINGGGATGGTATYTLSGGVLNTHGMYMGVDPGGSGTVTVSGTGTINSPNDIVVGRGGAVGHFIQSAGTAVNVTGGWLKIGDANSGAMGDYTMSGGTLAVNDTIMLGGEGSNNHGTFNLSGGDVTVGRLAMGQSGGAATNNVGIVNQTGGTMTANEVRMGWDNSNSAQYNLSAGTLTVHGDIHVGGAGGGAGPGATGVFTLSGTGTSIQDVGSPTTNGGWIYNGDGGTGNGTVNIGPGTSLTSGRLMAGAGGSATGVYNQTGGTVISGHEISIGDSGGTGVYNMSGGTLATATVATSSTNGGGAQIGWTSSANGTVNQTGGLVTLGGNGIQFAGRGSPNLTGVPADKPAGDGGMGGTGTYTLTGGTLRSSAIYNLDTSATASGTFNFNGGQLIATAGDGVSARVGSDPTTTPATDVFAPLPAYLYATPGATLTANVQAGGAKVDVNSFTVSFDSGLLHSGAGTDGGLTLTDSSAAGGGTLTLNAAGTFNGTTTVVANATAGPTLFIGNSLAVQDSTVNISFSNSVQFTSGLGSATFGGLSGSGNLALADTGAVSLTAGGNGSSTTYSGVMSGAGSFTKAGTGSLLLSASQSYSGSTRVNGGTLTLPSGVSLTNSSSVTVGGASATPGTSPTLAGIGSITNGLTINGVQVTGAAGHIAPHIGATTGTLSVGSLTLNGGSILDFNFGAPGTSDLIASVGALTLPTSGSVTLNLTNLGGFATGTYKLITESGTSNFTSTSFSIGTGISGFQAIFTNPGSGVPGGGTEVDLVVTPAKTWSSTAVNSDWSNAANWINGVPGSTTGTTNTDLAAFSTGSTVLTPAPDAGRNLQNITFDGATIGAYVIGTTSGNALLLTTGGTIQMTTTAGNTETINAPLVLEGASGSYTFANNATDNTKLLIIGGGVTGGAAGNTVLILSGTNTGTTTGVNAVNGVIANGAATTLGISKTGSGLWLLGGNNTFTGGVSIDAGVLALGNAGALNSAAPNAVSFGPASTGILALNGINVTVSGLNTTSPTATVVDGNPLGASATLTINSASPSSYAGVLADGPGGGHLNLVVSGGSLTLSGNSSATGTTDVTGTATLTLASLNALQDSTLNMTVANSVQFTPGVGTFNLGGLSGNANLTLQDTAAGAVTVNVGNNNSSTTYSGVMSGTGGVTKVGTGTFTLTNANTYSGTTRVSAGTLQLGNGTTSNGSVASSLIVNNASLVFANPNPQTYAGGIIGTGTVTKTAGGGTLTLTGNSSFSGGTTVGAGATLAIGPSPLAASPFGTGAVTLNGATLALQGSLNSGLTANLYNSTPTAADPVTGNNPDYLTLTAMNTHFGNMASPAVSVLTSFNGKTNLDYTNTNGARAPMFAGPGATQAQYGFPNLDNFEANFNGLIKITTEGDYTFSTTSDDGSVVFVNGVDTPVVNNNFYQGMTTRSGTVHLTAGTHAIALGYYEGGGGLGWGTTYSGPDTGGSTIEIPNAVLTPDANPLTVSGFQTYSNTLVVTANSTVNITGSLTASLGPLSLGAATLNVASTDATTTPYSLTFNGNSTLTGNGTLNVANSTGGGAGQVNLTGLGGAFSLTKTGPGVLSMSGAGTYSGGTVLAASSGLVIANNPGSLGTGPVTLNNTTTLRVVAGSPSVTNATLSGFNGGTNWTVNGNSVTTPAFNGNTLTLTDNVGNESRSVFFNTPQSVAGSFALGFTYTATGAIGGLADGAAVIFQNDPRGLTALGGGGGALGYGGITPSAAYQINVYAPNTIGTAVNANGATGGYTQTGTVNEGSGDPISVILIYDATGLTLTEILTDTVNGNSFSQTRALPSDLATLAGGPTAFFGFSGGTGGAQSTQTVSNFSIGTGVASVYANNVVLTGGSQATIDVGSIALVPTVTMGGLTVGSGIGTTLNLTATTAPIDTAYGLSVGPATINGNLSVNIANNGIGRGTLTLTGASNLAAGVTINQNSGTLSFNNTAGSATVGAGVTINVASAASMTIAGTVSALSGNGANVATAANRANINNSSTQAGGGGLNVTGTNQQVGGINGTGDTVVAAGASLTANHILQSSLVIGGTATSLGLVTIAASDAAGNPLAMAGGSAIAGSNAPMNVGGSALLAASGSSSSTASVGGSTSGVNLGGGTAAVPEPSSILLVVLGSLACLVPAIRRKARNA
jgi:fibronectin-binding autotransporter adhesin